MARFFARYRYALGTAAFGALIWALAAQGFGGRGAAVFAMPVCNKVVAIDAGHGGWDPGKVSASGVEEKDVNLMIAEKLQVLLEQSGAFVITTRADDGALADRKRADLDQRRAIANGANADVFISIHQNSYNSARVHGPQAFYFGDSEQGKRLAEAIQTRMNAQLTEGGKRAPLANSNYYVLKRTAASAVLVECGFLSSPSDTANLTKDAYQERVAWAIYLGLLDYFIDGDGKME